MVNVLSYVGWYFYDDMRWCCFMIRVNFILRSWDSHSYEFWWVFFLQEFKVLECLAMLTEL